MVSLDEVVRYLDQELKTAAIPDYPGAMNGLQLANSGKIGRVVAAVDASLPVIEKAAAGGGGAADCPSWHVLAGCPARDRSLL